MSSSNNTQLSGARASKALADAETPLLRNVWYVAARSEEITRKPLSRRILGKELVLYRKEDGTPVALDNRCLHRSFPLSRGYIESDTIVCGYHGLAYEPGGRCVRATAGKAPPSGLRVDSYPLVEQTPIVWIWMGSPDVADIARLPAHPPISGESTDFVCGYSNIGSSYIGLHENLHDLTHFSYLHTSTVGTPAFEKAEMQVSVEGREVLSLRWLRDSEVPPIWGKLAGIAGHRVDRKAESRYLSPALHHGRTTIFDLEPEGDRTEYHINQFHFITPESQYRTHYFWFSSRDFAVGDQDASRAHLAGIDRTFDEDKDALEWIHELCAADPRSDFVETSFASDRPALLTRKIIYEALSAE